MRKLFTSFIVLLILVSCNPKVNEQETASNNEKQQLIIFHAGSLSVPMKEVASLFMKENPDVEILSESAGSRQCARKITDLGKPCDIMASADYTVIDNLLIPEFADWNIHFASNEMTIVYQPQSARADEINSKNWWEILLDDEVVFGRSDPDSDPCGYRAVLSCKLAEKYYGKDGLASQILAKNQNYIRPKEVDLLALLESGNLDYIFLYRSVAQQHGLKYLILPDSVNLKNVQLKDFYATAECDVSGSEPGEVIQKKGEPMVYGITICKNAPNKELATKFVEFFLDREKGMKIMEDNGQPSVIPSFTETFDRIPENLKKYALNSK